MWKPILAGSAALLIAGSSIVYAQHRSGRPDNPRRGQPNIEDMRAFAEARLAGLKAGLALNPEQEKLWPAFEQAARDMQKVRLDRLRTAGENRRTDMQRDPAERMQRRATALTETGAALKKLADVTAPLYASLDDSQKRRFNILSRFAGADRPHFRRPMQGRRGQDRGFRRNNEDEQPRPLPGMYTPTRGEERL